MNTAARNNRFLIDVFSFKRWAELQESNSPGEFYQHLASEIIKAVRKKEALGEIADSLVSLAYHAYTLRQMEALEHISQILLSLPLPRELRSIARYYQGFCVKRKGELDVARDLFERVAEEASIIYRARAIIALGSVAFDKGDFQTVLPLYGEANHVTSHAQEFDPLAAFYTQHMMAVLRSIDGDNRGALEDLERMFPLARAVGSTYPPIYCNYLNSLAVELAELGRLEEAARVCRITLASPFADVYPEYRETWVDIASRGRRASRSVVSFALTTLNTDNVLRLPAPELSDSFGPTGSSVTHPQQPARILNYAEWKNKMVKEPNGDKKDKKSTQEMSEKDLLLRAMELFSNTSISEKKRRKMLEAIEKIVAEPEQD
jgi:tetratricopeptide (TPR) repeat protein